MAIDCGRARRASGTNRERGYGSALRGGVAAARGKFVIMVDSDDSYDFTQLSDFVTKLREGYDLPLGLESTPRDGLRMRKWSDHAVAV